jgi:hypothetical protein
MVSFPAKRQSKLVVDSKTVPAAAVALERFEPVAGRTAQIVERLSDVEHLQLAFRDRPDSDRYSPCRLRRVFPKQVSGGLVPEGLDHDYMIPV